MAFAHEPQPIDSQEIRRWKENRPSLVTVLESLGRPTYGAQKARADGDRIRCPFHHDNNPSGSIYRVGCGDEVWLYTCHACDWNKCAKGGPGGTGDVIHVVQNGLAENATPLGFTDAVLQLRKFREQTIDLSALSQLLPFARTTKASPDPAKIANAIAEMHAAQEKLRNDSALQKSLWHTRAVDAHTAKQFGIGYSEEASRGSYWAFPINGHDNSLMAIKLHAVDAAFPKSFWYPPDAKHGYPLYPVELQPQGPIWPCPGEFKGLAVISAGLPAIGVTSGESVIHVTDELIKLIGNRVVAIPPDSDAVGAKWAKGIAELLKQKHIESRIVDLDLQESGADIGDWLVSRRVAEQASPDAVRSELFKRFAQASVA